MLSLIFLGRTQNFVFDFLAHAILQLSAAIFSISIFFLIYWILPNRKLPVAAVLPTAISFAVLLGLFELSADLVSALRWPGAIVMIALGVRTLAAALRRAHQADIEEQQKSREQNLSQIRS